MTVHICEVDSNIDVIRRIPDLDVFQVRDRLVDADLGRPVLPFPRPPFPDPQPGPDPAGDQLVVLTIGNGVNVAQIPTSGADRGLAPGIRPFGGSLEPHVWFGTGLAGKGITHYRWSYRRSGAATFTNIVTPVIRHYAVDTGINVTFVADSQGPNPVGLFNIQEANPPVVAGAVTSWSPQVDARENTATAFFLSHLLEGGDAAAAAGLYELRLELFRADGTRVDNWAAEGITGRIPDPLLSAPFGSGDVTTIVAPAPNHYLEGGNIAGLRFDLRIDNNPCEAVINDPVTTNTTNDTPCGFYEYNAGATVQLSFRARHPNRFADFNFLVTRGAAQVVAPASTGTHRVGDSPAGAYAFNPATFVYTSVPAFSTLALLHANLPPCDKAAFALTLQVGARATDGWSTLTYLSATAIPRAIAFAPQ